MGSSSSISEVCWASYGHPDPLALTAGQLVYQSSGQFGHAGAPHRVGDGGVIVTGPLPQHLLVREPAPGHQIGDGDALRGDRCLGQQAQPAGHLLGVQAADVVPVQDHLAADGFSSRANPRSSVDLPHALGPTMAVTRPSSTSTDRPVMTALSS